MGRNKIIVLRGIPASGKSTWAMKYVKTHEKTIIVNRDSLRKMCGEYWVPARESLITELENISVKIALELGYDVIVDATNMKQKAIDHWKSFTNDNIDLEVKTFTISKWKAYWRDYKRGLFGGHKVGKKVIDKFYTQMQETEIKT